MQCPKHQNVQCPRMCKYIVFRENENSSTNVPVEEFFLVFYKLELFKIASRSQTCCELRVLE